MVKKTNKDYKSEIIDRLIKEKGYSRNAFAKHIGIPESTLRSGLSRGFGGVSIDIGIAVCKGLGITVEELYELALKEVERINRGF